MGDWTFFSNHGHVFFCLARDGRARLRDVAADVGLTERAVQKIVKDLQQAGYIEVRKQGRCNRYRINRRKFLRHPLESHCSVSKLVNLVIPGSRTAAVSEPEDESIPVEVMKPTAASPQERTDDSRAAATAQFDGVMPESEIPEPEVPEPEVPEPEVPEPEVPESEVEAPEPEEPQTANEAEPAKQSAERPKKPRKRSERGKDEPGPVDVRKQGSLF
jgi:DNA-binding Lrp family transcriptional regulator